MSPERTRPAEAYAPRVNPYRNPEVRLNLLSAALERCQRRDAVGVRGGEADGSRAGKLSTGPSAAFPQPLHDLFYVDKPVGFRRDESWIVERTGYADDLPIAEFAGSALISMAYGDRSTIHMLYDYE
jgi:hypothetical protein